MEEIYKPNTDGPEKVEVYSRENNDMLGDMPGMVDPYGKLHRIWTDCFSYCRHGII